MHREWVMIAPIQREGRAREMRARKKRKGRRRMDQSH